ncbi:MAG: hypothetical protein FWE72_08795 [Spirochaetaceae bacterium]|nr:hypothetical protein [Spirochaetaceae bacterium]
MNDNIGNFVNNSRKIEIFSVLLNRLREEKGLKLQEIYKKAFIDRKLYSKIMYNRHYQPSKNTAKGEKKCLWM